MAHPPNTSAGVSNSVQSAIEELMRVAELEAREHNHDERGARAVPSAPLPTARQPTTHAPRTRVACPFPLLVVHARLEPEEQHFFDALDDAPRPRPAPDDVVHAIAVHVVSKDKRSEICSICQEDFCVRRWGKALACGHVYHPDCIDAWLRRAHVCAMCRKSVLEQ